MIIHAMELFEATAERMRNGAERRIAVERAVIMLCDPSLDGSTESLLRRISALEVGASAVHTAVPTPPQTPAPRAESVPRSAPTSIARTEDNAPETHEPVPTDTADGHTPAESDGAVPDVSAAPPSATAPQDSADCVPFDRWNEVVAALGKTDRLMKAALGGSQAYIQGEYMLLRIANESFRDMINGDARHRNNLKAAIAHVTGFNYKIGPYREEKKTAAIENDPLDKLIESAIANNVPKQP